MGKCAKARTGPASLIMSGDQGRRENPVRGDMLIESPRSLRFSLCFSAARRHQQIQYAPALSVLAPGLVDCTTAAALKNKKELCVGFPVYKHAAPLGLIRLASADYKRGAPTELATHRVVLTPH